MNQLPTAAEKRELLIGYINDNLKDLPDSAVGEVHNIALLLRKGYRRRKTKHSDNTVEITFKAIYDTMARKKQERDPSIDPCPCGTQRCFPEDCDAFQQHQEWEFSKTV